MLMLSSWILFSLVTAFSVSISAQQFFYGGFKGANTNNSISLSGVARVNEQGVLKLTTEEHRVVGRVFHSEPLPFKAADGSVHSFSSSIVFAFVPEYPKLGGHGMAFAISPTRDLSRGLPTQYFGLFNDANDGNFSNHIFAVEFDTCTDMDVGDIDSNHVGIDINGVRSNYSVTAAYYIEEEGEGEGEGEGEDRRTMGKNKHSSVFAKRNLSLGSGSRIQSWIDYDSSEHLLNVTLSPSSEKPRIPLLSYRLDLSPILEEEMYVGLSCSTGLIASSHYVFGWSFRMNGEAQSFHLSSLPSLPRPAKTKHGTPPLMIILVSVLSTVFSICTIASAIIVVMKIRNKASSDDVMEPWELEPGLHRYSYQELKRATKGFRDKELLGHGGFGRVYRGVLLDSKNTQVAVKRISPDSKQGLLEFVSEIDSIGRLSHRNLVKLLGWCRHRDDLILVYDYMPNGSLDKFLFDESQPTVLSWEQRFRVLKGVASALLYLHEGYQQVVIHRDVKASNVMLDADLTGRLGDFGLARLNQRGAVPTTTRVVGTLGYLAPELPRTGKATPATDVYAFGALLLEVACGRRPVDHGAAQPGDVLLVDWVWDRWREGRAVEAVDPRLMGRYDAVEAVTVLKLGVMCSSCAVAARPSMREVVRHLEGEAALPEELRPPAEYAGVGGNGEKEAFVGALASLWPFSSTSSPRP